MDEERLTPTRWVPGIVGAKRHLIHAYWFKYEERVFSCKTGGGSPSPDGIIPAQILISKAKEEVRSADD